MNTEIEARTQTGTLGRMAEIPRTPLVCGTTPLEPMPNLSTKCGGVPLYVKRDDCTGLAFGGNKVRQLEFYFGAALAQSADTILITGAVQSNYVRTAAAAANKLGMGCHIQLEQRVARDDCCYRESGNVLLNKILGATLHSYPDGEDEEGADRQLGVLADGLRRRGQKPYVIPLAFGHPPLGALGYVKAAHELLTQIADDDLDIDHVCVASGSGVTHAGLLFGLRALGSKIKVTGACVRRRAALQQQRIIATCAQIAALLATDNCVHADDVILADQFLAPGYGELNAGTLEAIKMGARTEGLIVDPVYTGKALATTISIARASAEDSQRRREFHNGTIFVHTGGTPAVFAYRKSLLEAIETLP